MCRLIRWTTDPEKYFWNASLTEKTTEDLQRGAMLALKTLMDAQAIEGGTVVHFVSHTEVETITSMIELQRLGLVASTTTGGDVSGFIILKSAAETLEPITRIHSPKLILKEFPPGKDSDKSVLGLVKDLEKAGWCTNYGMHPMARGHQPSMSIDPGPCTSIPKRYQNFQFFRSSICRLFSPLILYLVIPWWTISSRTRIISGFFQVGSRKGCTNVRRSSQTQEIWQP